MSRQVIHRVVLRSEVVVGVSNGVLNGELFDRAYVLLDGIVTVDRCWSS